MSQPHAIAEEPDFELQMKSLAHEAEQFLDDRAGGKKQQLSLLEFFRPLIQHMELMSRAMTENTLAITRLEEAAGTQTARLEENTGAHAGLPRLLSSMHENFDQKNKLNQRLFDALHEELRGYKDGFLLEVFHRPIARDLVTLYDDLSELHRQMRASIAEQEQQESLVENAEPSPALARSRNVATGMDHIIHALLEILARIDVQRAEPSTGRLDKQKQRVVALETAQNPEEDLHVVSSVKPGFIWRERLLRPEEVIVKKWKEQRPAAPAVSQK